MRHTGVSNRAWTRLLVTSLLPAVVLLAVVACGTGDDIDLSAVYDIRLGGDTTAFSTSGNAFELSARNLDNDLRRSLKWGTASSLRTGLQRRPARSKRWFGTHTQRTVMLLLP